jgi:hypothetical protein
VIIPFARLYDSLTAAGIEVRLVYVHGAHSIVLVDHAAARSLCFPVAGDFDSATTALVASWWLRESRRTNEAQAAPMTDGPCRVCGDWPELTALGDQMLAELA